MNGDVAAERAEHRLCVRVYYEDTDFGGVVYHANYLKFFERARTEWLRGLGVSQGVLRAEAGLAFVVSRCAVSFRRPALMDDLLSIGTAIDRIGGASLVLRQTVFLSERDGAPAEAVLAEAVLAEAEIVVACVDAAGRPTRLPQAVARPIRDGG